MNGDTLKAAAKSFASCGHDVDVFPPGEPRPEGWIGNGFAWIVSCGECGRGRGVTDNEVVIRALVLEALGR